MIKNYLVIAWRNLLKNKVFSGINILGLTIGITCCMMIFLYIMNEFSVDSFHTQKSRIYRVMRAVDFDGHAEKVPYVSPPYAKALLNDFPKDIQRAVRILPSNGLVSFGDNAFNEKKFYYADADFFQLFSFQLLKGDPATVLKDPASIVLTESSARRYFGNEDPMGKVVDVDKTYKFRVTGIAKDIPSNSHLNFDMVAPVSNFQNAEWFKIWRNNNGFTYVLLNPATDVAALERNFPNFMTKS